MEKKGLSTVVTTILLILLIIVAIGGIWAAVNNFLVKGSEDLTLGKIGLDVEIQSAVVNTTNGMATVRVVRNQGISKATINSLKIIVEDARNSEIFDISVENFAELSVRTIDLNLTKSGILDYTNIIKISVAPVYVSDTTGKDTLAQITSEYKISERDQIITKIKACAINSDCGTDQLLFSPFCSDDFTKVLQYEKTFECFNPNPEGFCQQKTEAITLEFCSGEDVCFNGVCQLPNLACTPENVTQDCGTSEFIGFPTCYSNPPPERIIQDYDLFDCVNNTCQESIISKTIQDCPDPQICGTSQGSAECFKEVDCTKNDDCTLGQVCRKGLCVPESVAITGTVSSIWPFIVG